MTDRPRQVPEAHRWTDPSEYASGTIQTTPKATFSSAMLSGLCLTYADLLRRQRTAETAFARWTSATRRVHEFVWLGDTFDRESLLLGSRSLVFDPDHPLYESIHKMYGTARLNPYERELLYGFPYVLGWHGDKPIRGPLLTLSIEIVAAGSRLQVRAADEVLRFNSLPFRSEYDTAAHDQALARILDETPSLPLTAESLTVFVGVVARELPGLRVDAVLDGRLVAPPSAPRSGETLRLIDQAALFVAPKVNYFLSSDLEDIAANSPDTCGALGPLVEGAGNEAQVDLTDEQIDTARLVFPFPSNRAQRRVALLLDDPTTRVVRVEGPPGTGKSLTIANLACHLAASGRRVLITSQKDKALEVVDAKLRELDLPELPMTLLRHDRESKGELISRLDQVGKQRSAVEVNAEDDAIGWEFERTSAEQLEDAEAYASALLWESEVEKADRAFRAASRLRRLPRRLRASSTLFRAQHHAPETTDELAERASERRAELARIAFHVLGIGLERSVAEATRGHRQAKNELLAALRRDQRAYRNFSFFDRLKKDPDRAEKLLRMLPVWILSPDDAARLFPCRSGLFDVVIVDEASQVDLPSIAPIAYRASKLVIFGDTRQMQTQRFAFMSHEIATEAWQRFGMTAFDPDELLHPMSQSLLGLASIRAEEESLLDEHFRSLPPIIEFSNRRWYGGRLKIMTDVRHKRFGKPGQPIIELHYVEDGVVTAELQENEAEAQALVEFLATMVTDPDYAGASIGVLCLFEGQAELMKEMVTETIDPAEWDEHAIVVVNPDGFQGDERDVILYSLSWDNRVMPRSALSARQADMPQVQGMLNVAFTRARDEMHIFHSAPIVTFTLASGGGVIAEWLAHCAEVQVHGATRVSRRQGRVDSEFEAEVAEALRAQHVTVTHQYPACGFFVDLLCELDGSCLAVECDGEAYHTDEHGQLRIEDIERQWRLERAGYRVLRIPYRKWRRNSELEVQRVLDALRNLVVEPPCMESSRSGPPTSGPGSHGSGAQIAAPPVPSSRPAHPTDLSPSTPSRQATRYGVTEGEAALIAGLRIGLRAEAELLRFCRDMLGHKRLGPAIKAGLLYGATQLGDRGFLVVEDGEYFLTPEGRAAEFYVPRPPPKSTARRNLPRRRYPSRRRRSPYRYRRYRRY